jgi:hypothetical protein
MNCLQKPSPQMETLNVATLAVIFGVVAAPNRYQGCMI